MVTFHVEIIKKLNQTKVQVPVLVDEVTLERIYNESASTLTFTCNKFIDSKTIDNNLTFSPGDIVRFVLNNNVVFDGRVFRKSRNAEHKIKVTAYDKVRYLLNEDTVVLGQDNNSKSKYTLKELLDKITNVFETLGFKDFMIFNVSEKHADKLNKIKFDATVYEGQSYLDMILDTFEKIKAKQPNWNLSLYDHKGVIQIRFLEELIMNSKEWVDPDYNTSTGSRNVFPQLFNFPDSQMLVNPNGYNATVDNSTFEKRIMNDKFISIDTVENFSHEQTIDDDVYTIVKYIVSKSEQKSNIHIKKADFNRLNQYGPLLYVEELDNFNKIEEKATSTLREKGSPKNTFSVEGCEGNISVRGGTGIYVHDINVGHDRYDGFMLVKNVTHKFKGRSHTMDLTLVTHPKNSMIERVE